MLYKFACRGTEYTNDGYRVFSDGRKLANFKYTYWIEYPYIYIKVRYNYKTIDIK